ncbi:uncharacterized protein N7459_004821 [Penicillium hispanicum]|uniref:uncharacterized protein n=1 Tax=Penicillium hispanicum TaxID=1080232 RepID=UPI00254211B2|nr:uncharacterized protein N7459_004821 [Penicillium hispanicum]KAJ5585021.1 hypothetical protein N7459_004821 [Penicillium hispanicum]
MSASNGGVVVSLADLMLHHREILVDPLFWTSHHLEMLGCRFQHVDNVPPMEHIGDGRRPSAGLPNEGESEARSLARSFSLQGKLNALANLLLFEGSIVDKRSKGPEFMFAGQPVHRPHYTVFYRSDQPNRSVSQEPLPVIGYLNYTNKKLARVTPKEWKEDPYFVCVILSLAQLQERLMKPPRPTSHLSRLLVASPMDREFIHLYEAQITSDFLGMLDSPTTATNRADFPAIARRQIPFRPFETFQKRLWAELLAGNFLPHTSDLPDDTGSDLINEHSKRPQEQEDNDRCKRSRTS